MKTIERDIVTAYIVSSDKKLLLGKKDPNGGGTYVNHWHNPGGGVEDGETGAHAVIREVFEETGLDITGCTIELIDHEAGESPKTLAGGEQVLVKMQIAVYKVSLGVPADKVELAASDDLSRLQWFPVAQINEIDLTPPAKTLLARIGSDWIK